ncbi:MAG TPA: VWA domain-containing protein [Bryobacteraceae bacterium]|nr:VWA domain-containing protein [Bryobacteraceae bacterium]
MRRLISILIFCACAASAQQNPPDVHFQAGTQLVVEIVTVTDKSGHPVEGLTANDFVVTENGAPQTISFCEYQKLPEKPEPALTRRAAPNVQPTTSTQIAPEMPGSTQYRDHRLLALYFDMTAMGTADKWRALNAATKFIHSEMAESDLVAVMEFAGAGVRVLQDFTGDRDLLSKAIQKIVAGMGQGFDENADDDSASDTGSAFGQDDGEFNIFNTDRQLAALQTAVNMLGKLNEKKSLVYFASGLTFNSLDNQAQMQATTNASIRANVSIYTVDARGLVASPPLGDATHGSPGGVGMYSGASAFAATSRFERSQDTLYALAADTGGKSLLDSNDIEAGILQARNSVSSYYIIGYYTTNKTLDGKFRRIRITLKEASAKLDYRQGYYSGKEFNKFNANDKERQLEDALMLPDPITDLTIAMEVNYFQLNRAEYFVPVVMKIPGSELTLAKKRGAEHTLIDFIGEIKDEFGTTVQNVRDKVDIKLSDETAEQLSKRPIQYETGFTILPGTYTIKMLARDDETGRIGTYLHTFVIPNLNKEEKRIPISSVVLSSQRVDMKDAIYNAKDKQNAQEVSPLVQDGEKLIPSVTRVFHKNRDMYIYLQAYEQTEPTPQPLVAFATFYRGRTKAFETPPQMVTQTMSNRLKTMPVRFAFSLNQLPAGRYDCQVTVLDPTGQKAAFWQAPVMLVP